MFHLAETSQSLFLFTQEQLFKDIFQFAENITNLTRTFMPIGWGCLLMLILNWWEGEESG